MEVGGLREPTGTKQDLCCHSSLFLLYRNVPQLDNTGVIWHKHYWRGLYNCPVMIPPSSLSMGNNTPKVLWGYWMVFQSGDQKQEAAGLKNCPNDTTT